MKRKNKISESLGTTKGEAKCHLDFIGFAGSLSHFMYEVRGKCVLCLAIQRNFKNSFHERAEFLLYFLILLR